MVIVRIHRGVWVLACALAALLIAPALAGANTITVNSTADPSGAVSDCTLHDAITAANTNGVVAGSSCVAGSASGTDTINFSLPNPSTITLAGDLTAISSNIDVVGPGSAQLTIDGASAHRPFRTTSSGLTDSISGLTITHGLCDASCTNIGVGGAIYNAATLTLTDVVVTNNTASLTGGTDDFSEGGGIYNQHTLNLVLSTVSNNTVSAANATNQNGASGGGIFNNGTLTVDRSTISGNHSTADGGGVGSNTNARGGGLSHAGGSLTITRSTISGNSVSGTNATANGTAGGGLSMGNAVSITLLLDRTTVTGNSITTGSPVSNRTGGGIDASGFTGSSVSLVSSTISGNSAASGGSNLDPGGATRSVKNTIISNPLGGSVNCTSTNTGSQGFNLEDTNSCGFNQTGDQHGVVATLLDSTLTNTGGPTQTLALLTGSPAIDAGVSSVGENVDQRGLTRPLDLCDVPTATGSDGTDIGAFEVQGAVCPPPVTTTPTTSPISTVVVPDTSLSGKVRKAKRKATFTFGSSDPTATFMCKLDKAPFAPCSSPVTFKHLRFGKHKFTAEAVSAAGTDPSPSIFKFKLPSP